MHQVNVKPLSVNKAYQGRRFKTLDYKVFEQELRLVLPNALIVPDGPLSIEFEFGLSNMGGDWDNPIKTAQDVISAKYDFNDNRIIRGSATKVKVEKGKEYIKFKITKMEE